MDTPLSSLTVRLAAVCALALGVVLCLVLAASATAAPRWSAGVVHKNAYGVAGVASPFSGSGDTFIRGFGSNAYSIQVTNSSLAAGTELICGQGTWTGSPTSFAYQWYRNGTPIGGATVATYTTVADDDGTALQCAVRGTNASGIGFTRFSAPRLVGSTNADGLPSGGGAPAIDPSGATAAVGAELTCAPQFGWRWAAYQYQWLRNGEAIAGATDVSYTVQAADSPSALQCAVTATNSAGSVTMTTAAKRVVAAAAPAGAATITGGAGADTAGGNVVGQRLSCAGPTTAGTSVGFQWLRNGSAIVGATTSTYTIAAADAGKAIQCQATTANQTADTTNAARFAATTQVSLPAAIVVPYPSAAPPAPPNSIAAPAPANPVAGTVETCNAGAWSGSPTSYTYQWYVNGQPVGAPVTTAATSSTYTVQAADLPGALQCQVTATNAGGAAVSKISSVRNTSPAPSPAAPASTATATIPGSISVAVQLPDGMSLAGYPAFQDETGDDIGVRPSVGPVPSPRTSAQIIASGWQCSNTTMTCTRADALAPGESYPPIVLHVRPGADTAPQTVMTTTVSGGGASPTSATVSEPADVASDVPFGIFSFSVATLADDGADYTQAGGHPSRASSEIKLNVVPGAGRGSGIGFLVAGSDTKRLETELPPGFGALLPNFDECPASVAVASGSEAGCPISSAVGYIDLSFTDGVNTPTADSYIFRTPIDRSPLYNTAPPPGMAAQLSFRAQSVPFTIEARLRSDGDYGVTVGSRELMANPTINGARVTICSNGIERLPGPGQPDHVCKAEDPAAAPAVFTPFNCSAGAPLTTLKAASYRHPDEVVESDAYAGAPAAPYSYFGRRGEASPVAGSFLTGCDQLTAMFDPAFTFRPDTSQGGAPAGVDVDLQIPQTNRQDTLMAPPLKKTVVRLPEGLTLNAAAGNGLAVCTHEQIGLRGTDFPAPNPIRFDLGHIACPNASKIGTLEASTPVLREPLKGSVYLAEQKRNPFDTNFAIYLGIDDAKTGLVIKLPGKVEADPDTGRLTATFDNNPQQPLSDIELHFFGGDQAPLTTPATCGQKTTETQITPWSAADPDHPTEAEISTPGDAFTVDTECSETADQLPFVPAFTAGTTSTAGGTFSPFVTRITRDGGKELGRVVVTLPEGALADLSDVDVCSDAALSAAAGRSGKASQATPACPAGSQVGTTTVSAGSGPSPFYPALPGSNVSGRVFLTGRHAGSDLAAPSGMRQTAYGLAFEVPAVAGPFDVGNVIVRAAIYTDATTAQATVVSDKLPRILEGVPLDVRDVRVNVDREDFTLNPTSCDPRRVTGDIAAQDGTSVSRTAPFQASGCGALPFKPKLTLRLTGKKQTKTGKHPGIRAQVNQTGIGEAGIEKAVVRLPKSLALDPNNAQALCEFEDGTKDDLENHCPKGSIVGRARAATPLLKDPLVGNVYFVKNVRIDKKTGNQIRTLPMIIVALRGQIAVNLVGESSTTKAGKLVNTFDQVPDAPISKFNLNIKGGKQGIIAVTRTRRAKINLCAGRHIAETDMDGQNGRRHDFDVRMKTPCTKKQTKNAKRVARRTAARAKRG